MSQAEKIIIYDPSHSLENNALAEEALGAQSAFAQFIPDKNELIKSVQMLEQCAIIAFCGVEEDSCITDCKTLIKEKELHELPTIFVGAKVDELQGILGEYFQKFSCLPQPVQADELRMNLKRLFRKATFWSEQNAYLNTSIDARIDLTISLAEERDTIGNKKLEALQKLVYQNITCGGHGYPQVPSLTTLVEQDIIPSRKSLESFFEEKCSTLSQSVQNHLARTTYIAAQAAKILGLNKSQNETLIAATILKGSAARESQALRYQATSHSDKNDEHLNRFLKTVQDAALLTSLDLGDPEVGEELKKLSDALANEGQVMSKETAILYSASLIDSWCFDLKYWNPAGAYHLFRRLKTNSTNSLPDEVWAFTVRFLSEAISERKNFVQLPKECRLNPELLAEKMCIDNAPVELGEKEISLAHLEPGMLLTRDLRTLDGEIVLHQGTALDNDLIWRIWQLGAIRPLRSPMIHKL